MKHEIEISGYSINLRPVRIEDSGFIIELRNDSKLNKYLHEGASDIKSQMDWIYNYFKIKNDYYFVIEKIEGGKPIGLIGIYDMKNSKAEWGRWILKEGNNFAVESVLLLYRIAFKILNLEKIFCRTLLSNKSVISFHDSCGLKQKRLLKNNILMKDKFYDAMQHTLNKKDWEKVEQKLDKLAYLIHKKK